MTEPVRPPLQPAAIVEVLAELWPAGFTTDPRERRPLKVGIGGDIEAAACGALTKREIHVALGWYVAGGSYLWRSSDPVPSASTSTASRPAPSRPRMPSTRAPGSRRSRRAGRPAERRKRRSARVRARSQPQKRAHHARDADRTGPARGGAQPHRCARPAAPAPRRDPRAARRAGGRGAATSAQIEAALKAAVEMAGRRGPQR